MATPIKLKRSAVKGKRPGLSDLQLGELALNTNDGNIFIERDAGGVGIATTITNVTPWTENYGGESIYYNDKVGIGTTNPQGDLQIGTGVTVYGNSGIVSATKFYGDGSTLSNLGGTLSITADSGSGAGVALATQTLTIVGTTNEVNTNADGQQVQIGLPNNVTITNDLIVGSGVSIAGITTVTDTLKVGTAITAHAGIISATKFKPSGGTSAQFLKGDGSLDGNSYLQAESDTLNTVLGRGNSSGIGISVGISTLGKVSDGFVELYHDSNLVFQTVGTGVSISSGTGNTATIYGPEEIHIDPSPIGVGTTSGIVRIKGDLYVDGTEFIVNSETITLGDFVVGIASTATTDALTDGAGIGIGSIGHEKTFKYYYNSGTNPSLKSSENLNVATGKGYQIAQTEVLNATTLGSAVVNSSLTSVGTLGSLDVDGHTELDNVNVSSASTFNSTVTLKDNVKLGLGDEDDLELHHSTSGAGSTSYIDNNKGPLYIRNNVDDDDGGNIIIEAKSGKASAVFQDDEGVRLYFNNVEKFATTNEGINVSGLATVTDTLKVGTAITAHSGIITATTFKGALDGNAGTATSLATARNIGGVSFDGTANIDLPGVNSAGNQSTSSTSAGLTGNPNIIVSNIVGTALSVSGIATITDTIKVGTGITASAGVITATTFKGTLDGNATYAGTAGIATYATDAGISTYAGTAGIATYATDAGIATYAGTAGIATYAGTAGVATDAQGLTGSPDIIVGTIVGTALSVSGITTVGFATATDVWVSGAVTATSYYGDGSNLTGIVAGLWVSNDTGINTSTNVGIGTTTVSDATLVVDVGTASTAVVVQGSEGRLFSVTNSLSSGSIFSVNDISGVPSIDVDADGKIQLAPYGSTEYVGLGTTNPSSKLHVVGGAKITGVLTVGQIADSNGSVGSASSVLSSTGSGLSWVANSGGGGSSNVSVANQADNRLVAATGTTDALNAEANLTFDGTTFKVGTAITASAGIITATTFSGNATSANSATSASGLTGNPSIDVSNIVGTALSISGIATVTDTLKVGTAITAHAGIITATKFVKSSGTSTQFLKADGTVDSSTYLTSYTETSTLDDVLGRGNSSTKGMNVGISTLGNVSSGFVKLYNNSNLVFETVGTGVSVSNAGLNTATIFGPPEIIIDPHPVGVATTSGIVRIKGDLYVDGKNFIIDSETITLGDFVVGIASTVTTEALTDGAGIGIGSAGHEKTFKYYYNSGTNPSLKSSENLNVASGKGYQIDQTEVLNATTLGSAVVNSSLTSVGTLGSLTVTNNITANGNIVGTALSISGIATVTDTLKVGTAITAHAGVVTATTFDASNYYMASILTRDKYRFWGNTQWTMGMTNGMTFGGLDSYAITSQVTNHDNRGWVFLDTNHTDAQGAMSLNTIGELVVAKSIRAGGGESDTSAPRQPLDIIGDGIISGDVGIGTTNPTGTAALTGNEKVLAVGVVTANTLYGSGANLTGLTGASANTYGDASNVAQITVDANGKISGITNVSISGGGGTPTDITVANEASDSTCFPLFATAATGDLGPKSNAALTFDSTNGTLGATDFNSTSDIRLKTNIKPIDDPLAKVIQIEGVSFNWKQDNRPALGVIADQVEKILPELVRGDDPKTVNYNGLIGLLIEAVKEQQTQIDNLNERLSKLE